MDYIFDRISSHDTISADIVLAEMAVATIIIRAIQKRDCVPLITNFPDRRLYCVKLVKNVLDITLKDAKDLVDKAFKNVDQRSVLRCATEDGMMYFVSKFKYNAWFEGKARSVAYKLVDVPETMYDAIISDGGVALEHRINFLLGKDY